MSNPENSPREGQANQQNTQSSVRENNSKGFENLHQANNEKVINEKCLHNFVLGKQIGAGTFSKVCIAKHKVTKEQVAIKIIQKCKIENDADRDRLNREIKIMRKVRHPNIVQLYEILQTSKHIYLVMEYAARGELFDHIVSHEKLGEFEASKFLMQLVDAVEYLHQLGIAHRDLKPENLLLDHKYNIKMTDFGLSNIYPAGKLLTTACGSPSYACPEMLSGKPYNGIKADIWSIGIVLYAMCFGYLPFDNPNTNQLYTLIKQGKYQIPQFASDNLIDILRSILNVDPNQRFSIQQIRSHSFCKFTIPSNSPYISNSVPGIIIGLSDIPFQPQIQKQMRIQLKMNTECLVEEIKKNKHNQNTCTYYLLLQRSLRNNNKSLSNYYASKYTAINRFALIEKVKTNYDKRQLQKMQVKKFKAIQQSIKAQNKNKAKNNESPKTISKQKSRSKSNSKVIHSTNVYKPRVTAQNWYVDSKHSQKQQEQGHLKHNNMRNLLKGNKKSKFSMTDSKFNKQFVKKLSRQSQKGQKRLNQNKRSLLKRKIIESDSNLLQIPQEFTTQKRQNKSSPNKQLKEKQKKGKSSKKQNKSNSENKRRRSSPNQGSTEKRKKSR